MRKRLPRCFPYTLGPSLSWLARDEASGSFHTLPSGAASSPATSNRRARMPTATCAASILAGKATTTMRTYLRPRHRVESPSMTAAAVALYLFQQHPSPARTRAITDELRAALKRHGFAVHGGRRRATARLDHVHRGRSARRGSSREAGARRQAEATGAVAASPAPTGTAVRARSSDPRANVRALARPAPVATST